MRRATELIDRIDAIRRRMSDAKHSEDAEWLASELKRLRARLVEIDDELLMLRAVRSMTWGE
jgi:hypothetical protein